MHFTRLILIPLGVALLFTGSCVTEPLSESDKLWNEQQEVERQEMFDVWRRWCSSVGGMLIVNRPMSCNSNQLGRGCIPSRSEWNYRLVEHKGHTHLRVISNTYSCTER